MVEKETRGRPKTGQKVYKQVGFRLEEAKFDIYEKLAQEKGVESLSTYIRNNIDKLFEESLEVRKTLQDLEKENAELKRKLRDIQKILGGNHD